MTIFGVERSYREIRKRGLLDRGDHVAIAFSGGPDSLCLLHLLARLAPALDLRLVALHVDHGLRTEARQEARRADELAEEAGVPFRLLRAELGGAAGNLQERARDARALLLGEAAEAEGCQRLALGHTADDQAETVIMRAVRGAGPRGLAAMAWQDGTIIRPLLATTRQEIEAYLTSLHLRPVRDPTNAGQAYMRNRVRQGVMPLLRQENPRVVDALCRLAEICREEDLALTTVCGEALVRAGEGLERGLDVRSLAGLPAAMLPRVLLLAHQQAEPTSARPLLQRHGGRAVWCNPPAEPLDSQQLDRLHELTGLVVDGGEAVARLDEGVAGLGVHQAQPLEVLEVKDQRLRDMSSPARQTSWYSR